MSVPNWLEIDNLKTFLPALLAFVVSFVVIRTTLHFIRRKLRAFTASTQTDLDDTLSVAVATLNFPFYFTLSIYVALFFIELPMVWKNGLDAVIYIIAALYVTRLGQTFLVYSVERAFVKKNRALGGGLKLVIVGFLWLIGGAIVLQHFGYNVSTLIAGLGIGGIAVAFAMQSILADIFASFSIFLDQPFEIGDFIIVGEDQGTVKSIGIKSTRLTTLRGEELVVSNSELTTARIRNFKQMEQRRSVIITNLAFETSIEKIEQAKKIIIEAIAAEGHLRLDRSHVKTFAADGIVLETVFFVDTSDFLTYADANERVNLAIIQRFKEEGITLDHTARKVVLSKD